MKAFTYAVVLFALCASACQTSQAIRTSDIVEAVLEQQNENGIMQALSSALGLHQDKPESEKNAYVLVKYIVVPSKAEGFILAVEKAKKGAEKFDGYITYNLVKTVDDNITYYAWAAWESAKDLIEFVKSETAKELIEYTAKEDIVTLLTGVKPIV